MFFYCLLNLIFDPIGRKFFLLEEFLFLYLTQKINCNYVYLSTDTFNLYEKFLGNKIEKSKINEDQFLDEIKEIEATKFNQEDMFSKNKRKFYEEFLIMIENEFEKYFPFCLKSKKIAEFLLKSHIISLETLSSFAFLKQEHDFIIESGKNFGFDYLLYLPGENSEHSHSPYAVSIVNFREKLSYYELLGKIRIAKNYKKSLVIIKVDCDEEIRGNLLKNEEFDINFLNKIREKCMIEKLIFN